jgi:hypothetical protein
MISTYTVAEYTTEDTSVEVTYENSEGFIHKRNINIPHLEDGSIDEEYFQEILEGQLRGVNSKIRVGAISFTDPNAEVGIAST